MQYDKGMYKQTSIGKIPLDWEVRQIKDRFSRITTKNNGVSTNVLTISSQYGLVNQEEFFNKQVASKNIDGYYLLRNGEFAYNKSYSNGYPMGAIKRLDRYTDGVVSTLYICFKIDSDDVISDYYKYYFESETMFNEIATIAQEGARNHGLLNVNVGEFFSLEIPVPPLQEQQKISDILSTVDEQIDNVDQLIKKTKELKKGLMQQLLTKGIGHTEFKETEVGVIPKEWEVKRFGDIFKLSSGNFLSQKNICEGEYPVYGGNGINGYHNQYLFEECKIVIGRVGAKCGCVEISKPKAWITDNALYISDKLIEFDLEYIFYVLDYLNLNQHANQSAQPVISGQKIYALQIGLPTIEEQIKIKNILKDIDSEISIKEMKKNILQELKKGLMQQLLTGKIRVTTDKQPF